MNATNTIYQDLSAVILAGGLSRRMNHKDKALLPIYDQPMIGHIINIINTHIKPIYINANHQLDHYQQFNLPLISDELEGYIGPLAGISAALQKIKTDFLLTVPCDSPLIPKNLVERLYAAKSHQHPVVVFDGERMQPLFSIIPRRLLPQLQDFLAQNERRVIKWYLSMQSQQVDFSDIKEGFLNANTPEELKAIIHRINHAN